MPPKAPPDATKLFAGRLPATVTEGELRTLFEEYGTVHEVFIMSAQRQGHAGAQPACAFVMMSPRSAAEAAINALNNEHTMEGATQPITVSHARANASKGEAKDAAAAALPSAANGGLDAAMWANYSLYSPYAYPGMMAGMTDPSAMAAAQNPYANPYAAAAYWAAATPYMMAYAQQAQASGLDSFGGADFAAYAGMSGLQSPGGGAKAARGARGKAGVAQDRAPDDGKLFIGGLPNDVLESDIRTVFSQVGTVKEVHIMSGRSQSGQACAFVVFPDSYSAQLAIRTLNKTPWHSAPDAPPIIVRLADKAGQRKGRKKGEKAEA